MTRLNSFLEKRAADLARISSFANWQYSAESEVFRITNFRYARGSWSEIFTPRKNFGGKSLPGGRGADRQRYVLLIELRANFFHGRE